MFNKIKEITSKDGVLHFKRWNILSTRFFSIYLHGIYMPDDDKHLHSHPWIFISLVLFGSYTEELDGFGLNKRRPGNIAFRRAEQYHKIHTLHSKKVYTLNLMWGRQETWGYKVDGKFVDHVTYRQLKRDNKL